MTKSEAVRKLVSEFSAVPARWVDLVAENDGDPIYEPMWGPMFIIGGRVHLLKTADVVDEDDEMYGNRVILDKDDDPTNMFLYEVDGEHLIGVNACGFDFYDGVWDVLYDAMGLDWHDEE